MANTFLYPLIHIDRFRGLSNVHQRRSLPHRKTILHSHARREDTEVVHLRKSCLLHIICGQCRAYAITA